MSGLLAFTGSESCCWSLEEGDGDGDVWRGVLFRGKIKGGEGVKCFVTCTMDTGKEPANPTIATQSRHNYDAAS
jgi:hypothetical protein